MYLGDVAIKNRNIKIETIKKIFKELNRLWIHGFTSFIWL